MCPFVFKHVFSVTLNFTAEQFHLKLLLDMQLLSVQQSILQSLESLEKQHLCTQCVPQYVVLSWPFVLTWSSLVQLY